MKSKEKDLFERLSSGDESALVDIYDGYRAEFIQWSITSYNVDEELAADLFQDSVVAFYYNIRQGKLTVLSSSLKTYLFAIGKNLALKRMKKDSKLVVNDELMELNSGLVSTDIFEGSERKRAIAALLYQMGDPCKSILTLYYFDKFSMEAIAERLDYKNEHVAKSQKLRCFNKLKKLVLERFNQDEI